MKKINRITFQLKILLRKLRIISGLLLLFLAIVLLVSFSSYLINWQQDQSLVNTIFTLDTDKSSNLFGKIGNFLGNLFVFRGIGVASFIIPILLIILALTFLKIKISKILKILSHSLFFICWIPVFTCAITKGKSIESGIYGYQIYDYLSAIIGNFGLWSALIFSFILYSILGFDIDSFIVSTKTNNFKNNTPEESRHNNETEQKNISTKEEKKTETESPDSAVLNNLGTPKKNIPQHTAPNLSQRPQSYSNDIALIIEKTEACIEETEAKIQTNKPIDEYGHKLDLPHFKMPEIELLKDYTKDNNTSISEEELNENKNKIVGLLKNFNIGISRIKATIGPTVTLYEIVPEVGIRVAQVKKLQDDIALNLSALGIRIIAPMPGKGTIGIEVPRKTPSIVAIKSVISSKKFQNSDFDLPIVFGKTISNDIFIADLAKMPHLLMAGATGQGKSVGINAIIASLLFKKHPSELKFVLVDPKKVELSLYSKIERHYLAKLPNEDEAIITDTSKVINTLNSLCVEMDNRYDLLKTGFCKNIKEYNQKFKERKLNPENGHRYLPYIVLIVDEFADLIMTAGKEIEMPIARLAQLARAIGIHLIVATQRPSVNVITGMIKANFPARVAFRVISSIDSKTILDSTGAEQLIGKGDMLFFNGNDLTRLQCAFIDTPEVEKIAQYIGEQMAYTSAYQLPEYRENKESSESLSFNPHEKDSLFEEAARIIVSSQQSSTSMLQRQLKLGYNRAGRIMDQLESTGIVGSFNGAKSREVLISDIHSLEQFLSNLKNNT